MPLNVSIANLLRGLDSILSGASGSTFIGGTYWYMLFSEINDDDNDDDDDDDKINNLHAYYSLLKVLKLSLIHISEPTRPY